MEPVTRDLPEVLWREVLGDYLRTERRKQRRILTEVAAVAGVSPQYLSEIERGRKEPSSEILAAVTGALGLTLFDVTAAIAATLAVAARVPTLISAADAPVSRPEPSSGRAQLHLVA
ncbi:putative Xre family DNA-binding protein [Gordonia effusa NBRC 100432]|uniref:Putative Xre family DNA-binding protein n=1 Tax=Gordonia effusa NBRC 100432 TaxID=1077974 RepID=H0R5W0_9ACTN|nr:helix-turn-helix transcriptional regulator [Gordonia effusa]GAB20461.1 putative Xre family DNA-binding protein [Gordonia effusa NBRC 100432]